MILETFKRLLPLALLPAYVASALLSSACERIEPQPQSGLLLQAVGKFEVGGQVRSATLSLEAADGAGTGILFKVKDREQTLAEGELGERVWDEVLKGVEGPLQTEIEGPVARVSQSGVIKKNLVSVTSVIAVEANQGTFELSATRWALYHVGIFEHGLEGHVVLTLNSNGVKRQGLFTGVTTLNRGGFSRVSVGARIPGRLSGDTDLGAGHLFNEADATAVLSFPTGAGAMEVGGMRQAFTFDPETDLTPRGAVGKLQLEQNDPDEVVLRDDFEAHLNLRHVSLGDGKRASGRAHAKFSIHLTVNHRQVVVSGTTEGDAVLKTPEGKTAQFVGLPSDVQTLLDW